MTNAGCDTQMKPRACSIHESTKLHTKMNWITRQYVKVWHYGGDFSHKQVLKKCQCRIYDVISSYKALSLFVYYEIWILI